MTCTLDDVLEIKPRTGRHESQIRTLQELHARYRFRPIRIVETGTIRNDHTNYRMGDGWATWTWLLWAKASKSHVWTCDIDPAAIALCRKVTKDSPFIDYVVSDSVAFLRDFQETIHLLYLDSFDAGPPGDPRVKEACQHQLREIEAAYDKLDDDALVVLDDVPNDLRNGKGELSVPFLLERGWEILSHQETQVILSRPRS
ncbi:MAG: hypothetical protein KDB53_02870, partial [Planctomycetes bacterium]|nr:hypothetical protein [Planctomycetota bacterium]